MKINGNIQEEILTFTIRNILATLWSFIKSHGKSVTNTFKLKFYTRFTCIADSSQPKLQKFPSDVGEASAYRHNGGAVEGLPKPSLPYCRDV